MKQATRSKVSRRAKVGTAAAIVPTLLVGLVAYEQADTGNPTVAASESLELVRHRQQRPSLGAGFRSFDERFLARSLGGRNTSASAAVAEGERALTVASEAKGDRRRCSNATRQLERALERLTQQLEKRLPRSQRRVIEGIIDRLEDQIQRIRKVCRNPSGVNQ